MRTIPAADVQFQSACSRAVMKTIAVRACWRTCNLRQCCFQRRPLAAAQTCSILNFAQANFSSKKLSATAVQLVRPPAHSPVFHYSFLKRHTQAKRVRKHLCSQLKYCTPPPRTFIARQRLCSLEGPSLLMQAARCRVGDDGAHYYPGAIFSAARRELRALRYFITLTKMFFHSLIHGAGSKAFS